MCVRIKTLSHLYIVSSSQLFMISQIYVEGTVSLWCTSSNVVDSKAYKCG